MQPPTKGKYLVLIGDGMADYPIPELGGKTPLEAARTPYMDRIAACRIGLAGTIPDGMEPGSDIANLSLLGYDPTVVHTGRAPLEAASMGVQLGEKDIAFRMNLVTLDRRSADEIMMVSHSSGDISTEEATKIVRDLQTEMERPGIRIYPGVAYRNLLVWEGGPEKAFTIPPHDVLDQNMAPYLQGDPDRAVIDLMRMSWRFLENHPVNVQRRRRGRKAANSIWLWGQGRAPRLVPFVEKYGVRGGVISAVDLLKGIGIYAGFTPIYVEGATGYLDTNFVGKARAAIEALQELDFVFLHVEAPDEAAHNGSVKEKIQAIEAFDEKVVGTVLRDLESFEDYRIMVASDHYTPICRKTHTAEPTPFAWAAKKELEARRKGPGFAEKSALEAGLLFEKGDALMSVFLGVSTDHAGLIP